MSVPQYTTPTFTLTFTEQTLDLTQADHVYVTFRSGATKLTKSGDALTVGAKTIGVHLTQSDTARFASGKLEVQANWTISGNRFASESAAVEITENLLSEVVE